MKLLASDYDNTLNVGDSTHILKVNIKAINGFVKQNKFALNTGRSYESIKHEIHKIKRIHHLDFNYDYLSCCDGNLILNKYDGVIYCTRLDNDIKRSMIWLEKKHGVTINPIMYDGQLLEYEIIAPVRDVSLEISLYKICEAFELSRKEVYAHQLSKWCVKEERHIYLGQKDVTKSSAVQRISQLEKVRKCDIFTIGDEFNDIEMLETYNGYTFPWCRSEVKNVSKGRCLSVASLIKKISR